MQRLSFFLGLFFLIMPKAQAISQEEFQKRLEKHVNSVSGQENVSISMQLLGKNTSIFSHNAQTKLIPASSTKLITSMAALEKLGPGFAFETKIFLDGDTLILQGNGDPYLVSERLWLLARDVSRAGIKKIKTIKINNSAYKENYRGLLEWGDSGEPFTAVVSATGVNFNSLEVHVTPNTKTNKPNIEIGPEPHRYASVQSDVRQVGGNKKSLTLLPWKKEGGKEIFRLSGTIGRDSAPVIVYASVSDPDAYAANVFSALLKKEGIEVERDYGGVVFTPVPSSAKLIASQESLPLIDLLRLLNTYSNNYMAEQVFHALSATEGEPATMEKSRKAVSAFMKNASSCNGAEVDNGSGLSWNTKISAQCFVELLQNNYRDFRYFADLLGGLPIGSQTGSLKSRFKRVGDGIEPIKVRAKTGTLWSKLNVTSLVGYTQTASGEVVTFSILQNGVKSNPSLLSGMKDWEDRCVELIQQLRL